MKNSIIKDILNGVKGNKETMVSTKIGSENLKSVSKAYDKLKENFNSQQISLIEQFLSVYDKSFYDELDFYFVEGFKLGLHIAVECFQDN